MPEAFSVEQVMRAIQGCAGIPQVVATRLKCTRGAVINYLRRHPELNEAFLQERESAIDLAEAAVIKAIQGDPENGVSPDIPTARWLLENIGSPRGYGKHSRLDIVALNLNRLSDAQLERIARGEDPIRVTIESLSEHTAAITVDGVVREAEAGEAGTDLATAGYIPEDLSE